MLPQDPTRRSLFLYALDILVEVAASSDVNNMNAQNLGVCFGPVVQDTDDTSLDAMNSVKHAIANTVKSIRWRAKERGVRLHGEDLAHAEGLRFPL